ASQASGLDILNLGHVVIKGLTGTTDLSGVMVAPIDPTNPPPVIPTIKGVIEGTVNLSLVDLDKLTDLEISGTGHTVTLSPEQYVKWNSAIVGATDNTITFTTSPFNVGINDGVINF